MWGFPGEFPILYYLCDELELSLLLIAIMSKTFADVAKPQEFKVSRK